MQTNVSRNPKNHEFPVFHVHTKNSIFDGIIDMKELFEYAKNAGIPAIAITDHGVLTGVEDAKKYAKATGVKYIPGVEAYYKDINSPIKSRRHLVLMAKDEIGFKAISLAVTASDAIKDEKGFPIMTDDILNEFFGEGSIGYGHVVATSACMNGVLGAVLLSNKAIQKELATLTTKKAGLYDPSSPVYANAKKILEKVVVEIEAISEEIKTLTKIAKKPFTAKEKALRIYEGTEEYAERKAALDAEKEESRLAAVRVEELKTKKSELRAMQTKQNDIVKTFEGSNMERFNLFSEQIEALNNSVLSDNELYEAAREAAKHFISIFGKENFFFELQYHGIPDEAKIMPIIAQLANEMGVQTIAANDAHMISNNVNELKKRQLVRGLRFNKWEELFVGDEELYIKNGEELANALSQILSDDDVQKAMNGTNIVNDMCNVVFPHETHYPKYASDSNAEDAEMRLRRLSNEGIQWRYPNKEGWTNAHQERMEYELGVIAKLGFCDYLCIVEDFLSYGRLLGKIDLNDPRYIADPYNIELLKELGKDNVGLGIGPGRGSAVGSLVSYLIGITGIDPMKYGLIFERFLNEERVSMPDIDSDFKPDIRNKVLDYVKHKYGSDAVCCIMTKGTLAAKGSVRSAARLYGSEKRNDTKEFLSLGDAIAKVIPNEVNASLADHSAKIEEKFGDNADAMAILENAKLLEGTFASIGMHAAGVIIADNQDVKQYVPLMYNKEKGQWMTQCEKDPCEALGLLKMDFLGLKNLSIITETLREIKKNTGKNIQIEDVPFEADVFAKIFATGNTNSVFQFESGGMKKMLRQFKPETIEDIILLVAAYRPGPMQYLDDIIAVKHGRKSPNYIIPEMEEILGKTYGYPVYQEQIMQIFNKFAGFTLGESDIIRRLMSKKKHAEFMKYEQKFIDGLCASGADKQKAKEFWDQLVDFSSYAFNKSHAAAYAFVAYYTAWLKCRYPAEYLCSVMNDTAFEKLGGLIADSRGFGIKVNAANINSSDAGFSTNNGEIVVGLGLIKGVANAATAIIEERENGKYQSFMDFMLRTRTSKDVAENLIYAGAFDDFIKNRQALVDAVPEYCDLLKKIKAKEAIIDTPITETDNKEREKAVAKRERAITAKENLIIDMQNIAVDMVSEENLLVRLENEKEKIGAFVSAHPMDSYGLPKDYRCTNIADIEHKRNISIMGIIKNLVIRQRKSDNADMAFFTLEDQSGSIDIRCFTQTYANFKQVIAEDAVVIVSGDCVEEVDNITDETVMKVNAQAVKAVKAIQKRVLIEVESIADWYENVREIVKPYRDKNGLELVVFDKMHGKCRKTNITVNAQILNLNTRKVCMF